MFEFFDTHAHLDDPDFAPDLDEVLDRAREAGITRIISIGTDLESSRRAILLSENFPEVYAVVGWHPSTALDAPGDIRDELRRLSRHPKVVALGETGLDYHRLPSSSGGSVEDDSHYKRCQAGLFQQHLEIAAEAGLNCVIHQRSALEDALHVFGSHADKVRGQFHCFAEDAAAMRRILNMGSVVSFTGIATFRNGQNIRDTLAAAPLGRFMLETDCPYLAPVPHRGKRCEPAHVKEVAATAAEVKACSLADLSHATCNAARQFFPKLR